MPGKRISELTALSGAGSANNDDVVIFDATASETKRISRSQLAEGMQADVQVLSNKTLALGSNTVTGTTAQFNTALTDNNFATQAGAEALTNKTIDSANNTLTVNYKEAQIETSNGSRTHLFTTVAALLADTGTYTTYAAGQIIEAEGFRYEVAASSATDHHVTTAGGVKLYVLDRNGATPASAYPAAPSQDTKYLYGPNFVTDGTDLYNFPADDYQRVIGQEYLAAFHKRVVDVTQFRIKVFGDSRPAGNSQSGNFLWHNALRQAAQQRGYRRGVFVNNAIGGSTIQDWTNTHVDTHLNGTDDPHLIVFCAGINDLYIPFGPATPEQVVDRLDAFLTKVRVTKGYGLSALSVAVVVPISAYNPSQGRDPRFIEPLRTGFKRLARKHQVCVIDGYGVAADGRNQRGLGYAADITAPEVIHQNNVGMIPIITQLIDAVMPNITPMMGGGFYTDSGSLFQPANADLPNTYPVGVSHFRATGGGWPLDGFVETLNFVDDIQVQYNYATGSGTTDVYLRKGRSNAWGAWVFVVGPRTSDGVSPASGFSLPASGGMRVVREGNIIVVEGYITMDTPGIVAANTTVATIPSGYRPVRDSFYGSATVWNGTAFAQVLCRVLSGGELQIMADTPINANRIWLNASWSVA